MKRTHKAKQKPSKAHIHITALTVVIVIAVIVASCIFTIAHVHSESKVIRDSSADAIAGRFNTAMANGDRAEVDSLESAAFKSQIERETTNEKNTKGARGVSVTDNFYDIEKSDGDLAYRFDANDLSGAKVTFTSYNATDGIKGIAALFSEASGSGEHVTFSPSFALDLIPSGNSWLVDGVLPYVNNVCRPDAGC